MNQPSRPPDPYQAEDDHRTLSRAAEIQVDKGRMAGAKRHHLKQKQALKKVGSMFGKGR